MYSAVNDRRLRGGRQLGVHIQGETSARQIADHLGHNRPSLTQDVYMGRGLASPEADGAPAVSLSAEENDHQGWEQARLRRMFVVCSSHRLARLASYR